MTDIDDGTGIDNSTDGFGLLPPDENLDTDELGDDIDEVAYAPLDWRPVDLSWGFTPSEARSGEPLSARLAREIPDEPEEILGDGIGDTTDTDGEVIDDQVGSVRAGRLMWAAPESFDSAADYWANDIGIDGAGHQRKRQRFISSWVRTNWVDRELCCRRCCHSAARETAASGLATEEVSAAIGRANRDGTIYRERGKTTLCQAANVCEPKMPRGH